MKIRKSDKADELRQLQLKYNKKQSERDTSFDIVEYKTSRYHTSYSDFIDKLSHELKRKKVSSSISDGKDLTMLEQGKIIIKSSDLFNRLLELCDFARDDYYVYYQDYDTKLMKSDIDDFVKSIISELQVESHRIEFQNLQTIATTVASSIKTHKQLRRLNVVNHSVLTTTNNLAFDLKTREEFDHFDLLFNYDILRSNPNHYLKYDELSDDEQLRYNIHVEQINRIFDDWSSNNKEKKKFLFQICHAVLQGHGHGKFVVLKGEGGNGKSSFLNILKKLAGRGQYVLMNAHQWNDFNSVNQLNESIHVIIGDDAVKNQSMSAIGAATLKSLTTGQEIDVNVKYERNRKVKTNALYVQATNSDLQFFENNNAILRRLIVYLWDAKPYQKSSDDAFNLDELIEDEFFIDVLFTIIINQVDYFDDFSIPTESQSASREMLNDGDSVSQFMEDAIFDLKYYQTIPMKVLFEGYNEWRKLNNPDGGKFKYRTFVKAIIDYCKMNHIEVDLTVSTFTKFEYKRSLLYQLKIDNIDLFKERQTSLKFDDFITLSELNNFSNNLDNYLDKELTERQIHIIKLLALDRNLTHVSSLYSDYI